MNILFVNTCFFYILALFSVNFSNFDLSLVINYIKYKKYFLKVNFYFEVKFNHKKNENIT